MATVRTGSLPIYAMDSGVYQSTLDAQLSLTNANPMGCTVMVYPTGSDLGVYVQFKVPSDYVSTPKLILKGVIDGTPGSTFGVAARLLQVALSDSIDQAREAEDANSNATWTGYADEDIYEISITLTPTSGFTAERLVQIWVYRDDSADTTTWDFLLLESCLEYANA